MVAGLFGVRVPSAATEYCDTTRALLFATYRCRPSGLNATPSGPAAVAVSSSVGVSLPSAPIEYRDTVLRPLKRFVAYRLRPSGLTARPAWGPAGAGTVAGDLGVRPPSGPTENCAIDPDPSLSLV